MNENHQTILLISLITLSFFERVEPLKHPRAHTSVSLNYVKGILKHLTCSSNLVPAKVVRHHNCFTHYGDQLLRFSDRLRGLEGSD